MKISTKGLYAVRFMVFLAGHGGTEPVPLKEIAEATSISRKYLEQIASSLAAAQLWAPWSVALAVLREVIALRAVP